MCGVGAILRVVGVDQAAGLSAALRAPAGPWSWTSGGASREAEGARAQPGRAPGEWLIDEAWLDALDEQIAWRGPDGAGRFRQRIERDGVIIEVALVHRRLSIIDHAGGAQPMTARPCAACDDEYPGARAVGISGTIQDTPAEERPTVVAFNGCIYNHRALRQKLEAAGHVFASDHSDTEVLLHAWREHLPDFDPEEFGPCEGMYALALWNAVEGTLVAGRDPMGEKPLYFWRDETAGTVVLASTAGAVDAARNLITRGERIGKSTAAARRAQIATGAAHFLHLGFCSSRTPIVGIESDREWTNWADVLRSRRSTGRANADGCLMGILVIAGTIVGAGLLAAGGHMLLSLLPLSTLLFTVPKLLLPASGVFAARALARRRDRRPGALAQQVREALQASVAGRLDADVPIGCFLSGGIDSSIIAAMAREHAGRLDTFCVRMPEAKYDESGHAEVVARHLGTRHTTLECDASNAAEDLVGLIERFGLPFGDSSVLPTYWLCKAARRSVKVALSGDGGDELFYGYERYRAARYFGFPLRLMTRMIPTWRLDLRDPTSVETRRYRMAKAARYGGYTDLLAVFPIADLTRLVGRRLAEGARPAMRGRSPRNFDLDTYLPDDLLRKTDLASMSVGLEVRSPMLDRDVVALARSIPAHTHTRGGVNKAILRDVARDMGLPQSIIERPKQGFAIPISDWFRTDFGGLRGLLLDHLTSARPFGELHDAVRFDLGFVRQMLDEHWAAGGLTPMHTTASVRPRDHGQRLFVLLALSIWARGRASRAEFTGT